MTENEAKGKITFTGSFNDEIRERMRVSRLEKGLTLNEAAKQFQVNYSTYRKWEVGPTVHASPMYFPRIKAFLQDELTNALELDQDKQNTSVNGFITVDQPKTASDSTAPNQPSSKTLMSETMIMEGLEILDQDCRFDCALLDSLLLALHQKLVRIIKPSVAYNSEHQE